MTPLAGGRSLQSFTQICTSPGSILDVFLPTGRDGRSKRNQNTTEPSGLQREWCQAHRGRAGEGSAGLPSSAPSCWWAWSAQPAEMGTAGETNCKRG